MSREKSDSPRLPPDASRVNFHDDHLSSLTLAHSIMFASACSACARIVLHFDSALVDRRASFHRAHPNLRCHVFFFRPLRDFQLSSLRLRSVQTPSSSVRLESFNDRGIQNSCGTSPLFMDFLHHQAMLRDEDGQFVCSRCGLLNPSDDQPCIPENIEPSELPHGKEAA